MNRRIDLILYIGCAVLLVGAGTIWWRGVRPAPAVSNVEVISAGRGSTSADGAGENAAGVTSAGEAGDSLSIWVHVAGAVEKPGVYRMKKGQRVYEVIEEAMPSEDADLDLLNLAEVLRVSQKVYVPKKGENPPHGGSSGSLGSWPPTSGSGSGSGSYSSSGAGVGGSGAGGLGAGAQGAPVFPIDINAASQQELEALPGVGPVLASAIIERRSRYGPFQRPEDLKEVPGIGEKTYSKIAPFVTVR